MMSSLILLVVLVGLFSGVSAQQQYCRVDGYEFPCPRVVESVFIDYRVYGAIEAVAYTGLPRGQPLDILEAMFTGEAHLLAYFNGANKANETIPHTYPRGIVADFVTHTYYPVIFLPNAYTGGRAPAPTAATIYVGGVTPIGRVEPMAVPLFERPTDARIRDTVIASHIVLRQHGQSYHNSTFAFFSYDLPEHRGPSYTSEVWVFPWFDFAAQSKTE